MTKKKSGKKTGFDDGDQDWNRRCENCGEVPTLHPTGLCGPCCTGDASTAGGNW